MPQIPITSTFGYLGVALVSLAIFLFLTGSGIIKFKSVSVMLGKTTIGFSIFLILIGSIFIVLDNKSASVTNQAIGTIPDSSENEEALVLLAKAQNWQVIGLERFDNNDANWNVGKSSSTDGATSGDNEIANGKYTWQMSTNSSKGAYYTALARLDPHDTFYLAVDAKSSPTSIKEFYGLIFHSQGTNENYQFRVYPKIEWFSVRYRNVSTNTWITLLYLPASGLKSGENQIAVVALNSEYWFYINDTPVGHVTNTKITGGLVGLIAGVDANGNNTSVEFDNLEYRSTP